MTSAIIWAIATIIILAIIIVILAWFYERATREVSLVKTGIGGRKVVMDGGTIAIPYFHEISKVYMQTLRLEVQRIFRHQREEQLVALGCVLNEVLQSVDEMLVAVDAAQVEAIHRVPIRIDHASPPPIALRVQCVSCSITVCPPVTRAPSGSPPVPHRRECHRDGDHDPHGDAQQPSG